MADKYIKCEDAIAVLWYNQDECGSAIVPDIEAIPAADVAPVVHAHYIINEDGDPRCSACGAKYIDSTKRYCPDCGARMDEVDMREV